MRTLSKSLAFCLVMMCQASMLRAQVLPFQSYVVRDGLPSNHITSLFQDSRGFLWIGTDNGLSLYDGTEFRNFTTTDGLPNLFITSIFEKRESPGTLWIGTIAGGIVRFEEGKFTAITVANNELASLYEDPAGTVWCSTHDQVFTIAQDSAVVFGAITGGNYEIGSMGDSVVLFLGRKELLFYHRSSGIVKKQRFAFTGLEVASSMLVDRYSTIWILTSGNRLGRVDVRATSFHKLHGLPAHAGDRPAGIIDDGRGHLWVTTSNRILRIDKATYATNAIEMPGMQHIILSGSIMLDREGNIWLGTVAHGLLKLADQRILRIALDPVNTGSYDLCAAADTGGHIWVSTQSGLWEVYRSGPGEWKKQRHTSRPRDSGILIDPVGRLWELDESLRRYNSYNILPQAGGPSRLQPAETLPVSTFGGPTPGLTFTIVDRNRGWFAVHPAGFVEVDIGRAKVRRHFTPADGLLDDTPRAVLVDRSSNVWSGTWTAGLNVMHQGADTFRTVLEFPGLPGSGVRSLREDSDGTLWIGTRYGGIIRYRDGTFTQLSVKEGLVSNAVWCIAETENRIWCGTDVGMESVDQATGRLLPHNNDLMGERVYACGAYRNEYVWSVLANTLVILQEPEARITNISPPIYIKSFSVNGVRIAGERVHQFSHDQNSTTIEYVGLSFKGEKAVRYRYRMLGVDSNWTIPSRRNSVTFASLTPGSYTFEVHAINADGVPSTTPATLRFVIVPPVWQRWWFIALTALAIASILGLLYRYRVARILEMERLRTRIAADLHDDVGTNLSSIMLASQNIERELPPSSAERKHLSELRSRAGATQEMLKDIVWLLNPRNDTVGDFILKLKEIARRQLMDIPCTFNILGEERAEGLNLDFKRNVVLLFKEAVTNIVKHSGATAVVVDLIFADNSFTLRIQDNGKGFVLEPAFRPADGNGGQAVRGNGLTNLRTRAQHIGGSVEITSAPGKGTTITLLSKMANTRSTIPGKKRVP